MRRCMLAVLLMCAPLGACRFQDDDAQPSARQSHRDSMRNSQRTTGQRAVGRALDVADTAAARAQRTDSLLRQR